MLRLRNFLLERTALLWFSLAAGISIMGAVATLLQAYFMAIIVNAVFISKSGVSDIMLQLAALLAVMTVKSAVQWGSEAAVAKFAARVKSHVRAMVLHNLFILGPVALKRMQTGDLAGLLTTGMDALETYLARYLPQLIVTAAVPVLVLMIIAPADPVSGLLLLVTAPAIPVFLMLIGRWAEGAQRQQWKQIGRVAGHFLDVLQGLLTLRLFGRSQEQAAVIERLSGQVSQGAMHVLKIAFLSAFMLELTATISTAIVAVAVGLRLLYGTMAFEQAFMILLLVPEFFQPLRSFGASYHTGLAGAAVMANLEKLISSSALSGVSNTAMPVSRIDSIADIVFEDVWFKYPDRHSDALEGVTFSLRRGEQVALIGPSGSGKSTIAALLLGFIQPIKGEIRVNDIPVRGLPASLVTYLPQKPYIFQGTIANNIRMGCAGATMEEVQSAARQAKADEFIAALPEGYNTIVGERGYGLSGGEKQRLAIARAFLRNTPVIILDEPMASLDAITETAVRRALELLFLGKTVLVIAHTMTTARSADRILDLTGGKITQTAEPAALYQGESIC